MSSRLQLQMLHSYQGTAATKTELELEYVLNIGTLLAKVGRYL